MSEEKKYTRKKKFIEKCFFFEIIFYRKISILCDPDWGVLLCRSAVRGLKNEPIWPFSWYPPEKRKNILQLSLLHHFSHVSALLEACYSRSSTQFHIFVSFLILKVFLMDFDVFLCFLMVFGGFWCPLPRIIIDIGRAPEPKFTLFVWQNSTRKSGNVLNAFRGGISSSAKCVQPFSLSRGVFPSTLGLRQRTPKSPLIWVHFLIPAPKTTQNGTELPAYTEAWGSHYSAWSLH